MLSARRVALQGLTVPLTPIMTAVLGLWPEEETTTLPDYYPTGLAKRGPPGKKRVSVPLMEHYQESRDLEEVQLILAAIFAMEGVF